MGRIFDWSIERLVTIFNIIDSLRCRINYASFKSKYGIHRSFRFNGRNIEFYGDGEIIIGENSYIGSYSWVASVKGLKVLIGKNCAISHFVHIYTSNYFADKDFSNDDRLKTGNVCIGDYCFIGIKASVMGPVTIGENSVIGANSLVTRDMPPHSISVGVPAKVVKFKSYLSYEEKCKYAVEYKEVLSESLIEQFIPTHGDAVV